MNGNSDEGPSKRSLEDGEESEAKRKPTLRSVVNVVSTGTSPPPFEDSTSDEEEDSSSVLHSYNSDGYGEEDDDSDHDGQYEDDEDIGRGEEYEDYDDEVDGQEEDDEEEKDDDEEEKEDDDEEKEVMEKVKDEEEVPVKNTPPIKIDRSLVRNQRTVGSLPSSSNDKK